MQLGLNLGFSPPRLSSSGVNGLQGVKFWTFTEDPTGLLVRLFVRHTSGLRIDYADGVTITPPPNATIDHVLKQSSGITLYPTGKVLQLISTFPTSPFLRGTVDVSDLPDLTNLTIRNSNISSIKGYEKNSNLHILNFSGHSLSTTLTLPSSFELMTGLREFACNLSNITGTFPSLTGLVGLISVKAGNNFFSGSLPSLQGLTSLVEFLANNNEFSGSIPNLAGLANLIEFVCNQNELTTIEGTAVPVSLGSFEAQHNLLTAEGINKILQLFVDANRATGIRLLNLAGTGNAAPTGQGLTDKATLISRGWTVITN